MQTPQPTMLLLQTTTTDMMVRGNLALRNLRLRQVLLLPCHEVLLFLLPPLKRILLIRRQRRAERRETGRERRLGTSTTRRSRDTANAGKTSTCAECRGPDAVATVPDTAGPGVRGCSSASGNCGLHRTVGNSDLRDQERLTGIANAANELGQRLVVRVLIFLYQ